MRSSTRLSFLTAFVLTAGSQTASAQSAASPVRSVTSKDGTTATLFALLIPGGGHLYAGETGKGLSLMVGSVAAVGIGYADSRRSCKASGDTCDVTPLVAGDAVALGLWLYGVVDAHNAARRVNLYADSRHGRTLAGLRVALR